MGRRKHMKIKQVRQLLVDEIQALRERIITKAALIKESPRRNGAEQILVMQGKLQVLDFLLDEIKDER